MTSWISTLEALPDRSASVLVVCSDYPWPHIISWNNETPKPQFDVMSDERGCAKGFWDNGVYLETEVTHWMYLPEIPKEYETMDRPAKIRKRR